MCNCNEQINNSLPGNNAYTKVKTQFTVPAVNSNVTINVLSYSPFTGEWAIPGQIIFIESAGYYEVISSSDTQIIVKNLGYSGNAFSGTIIVPNKFISPAGIPGINSLNPGIINHTLLAHTDTGTNTRNLLRSINLLKEGDTAEIEYTIRTADNILINSQITSITFSIESFNTTINSTSLNISPSIIKGVIKHKAIITRTSINTISISEEIMWIQESALPVLSNTTRIYVKYTPGSSVITTENFNINYQSITINNSPLIIHEELLIKYLPKI